MPMISSVIDTVCLPHILVAHQYLPILICLPETPKYVEYSTKLQSAQAQPSQLQKLPFNDQLQIYNNYNLLVEYIFNSKQLSEL